MEKELTPKERRWRDAYLGIPDTAIWITYKDALEAGCSLVCNEEWKRDLDGRFALLQDEKISKEEFNEWVKESTRNAFSSPLRRKPRWYDNLLRRNKK